MMKKKFLTNIFIFVIIENALAEGLRDVKPPVSYPFRWNSLLIVLVVFVLLGIIALCLWLYKNKKKSFNDSKVVQILPWQKALGRLDALIKEDLLAKGEVKEYFLRLSDILRRYFEEEMHISAPEMTTEEFLIYLKDFSTLTNVQKNILKEFLTCCDMVKFAKFDPGKEHSQKSMEIVRKLIEETRKNCFSEAEELK